MPPLYLKIRARALFMLLLFYFFKRGTGVIVYQLSKKITNYLLYHKFERSKPANIVIGHSIIAEAANPLAMVSW